MRTLMAVALAIVISGSIVAQDTTTVEKTIQPPQLLIKITDECLKVGLEDDVKLKAKIFIDFASNRVDEIDACNSQEKPEVISALATAHGRLMSAAFDEIIKSADKGQDIEDVIKQAAEANSKNQEALKKVLDKAPSQAKDAIKHAMEMSSKGHDKAVEHVKKCKDKPCDKDNTECKDKPKNIEINKNQHYILKLTDECIKLGLEDDLVCKIRHFFEVATNRWEDLDKGFAKENPELIGALANAQCKLLNGAFDEIKKCADKGLITEEIFKHANEATWRHMEALKKVLEKAPEQAKDAIRHAIEMSKKGHNNVLEHCKKFWKNKDKDRPKDKPKDRPKDRPDRGDRRDRDDRDRDDRDRR